MISYSKEQETKRYKKEEEKVSRLKDFMQKFKKDEISHPDFTNYDHASALNADTFRALYDNHPDAVFLLNLKGNALDYNSSVKKIFGYSDEDLSGSFLKFFDQKDMEKREIYFKGALNGTAQNYHAVIFHKNGDSIDVDITYIPMINKDNEVIAIYGMAKDITLYKKSTRDLVQIKDNLELSQQVANFGSWEYDILNDEWYWSKQQYKIYGLKPDEIVPNLGKILQFIHPEDRENFEQTYRNAIKLKQDFKQEYRIRRKDGALLYVVEEAKLIQDKKKDTLKLIGTILDVTLRKLAEQRLKENELRYKNIFDNLEVGIWSIDAKKDQLLLHSPGMEHVLGHPMEEINSLDFYKNIIHPEDLPIFIKHHQDFFQKGIPLKNNYRIYQKNGSIRWIQDQAIPVFDENGDLIRLDGIFTDITEYREAEEVIKHLAYNDYLTNIPNRRKFDEKIDSLIEECTANNTNFFLLNMDLDAFKNINSSLGSRIGDQLLQGFVQRIQRIVKQPTFFARIGSDEFSILLEDSPLSEAPVRLANEIISQLQQPFFIDRYELYVTASIGISSFPSNGETSEELQRNANAALFRAKENGKNNFQIYSSSLNIESYKLFTMERDLRKAIKNNEFFVYFQPKVHAITNKIVGAEALIRWKHPEWGMVSPKDFISIAEENGFIIEIGEWVLKQVCQYLKTWEQSDLPLVPISVNISPKSFLRKDWTTSVLNIINDWKVNPSLLEFEITETTLLHHNEMVQNSIEFLKEVGIKVSLDDFGTGYSSLTHLERYPIDTIKIDKSFIGKKLNERSEMIIKSTLFLAKGLKMTVVAEGVETMEQLEFLQQQGCEIIQGYLFSKAVSEPDFKDLLKQEILYPANTDELVNIKNRRKYNRLHLSFPLSAEMTLIFINGRRVNLGKTEVLIKNIGYGGIKILSTLELPVRADFILQFEATIMNQQVKLNGVIVWKQEDNDIYQYGIKFHVNPEEKESLVQLLNKFSSELRKSPVIEGCNFIQENEITYLKK